MTNRILSQSGNVIAADFRPSLDIDLDIQSEVIYCDDAIMVTRTTATIAGEPFMVVHFMGDLVTGHVIHL